MKTRLFKVALVSFLTHSFLWGLGSQNTGNILTELDPTLSKTSELIVDLEFKNNCEEEIKKSLGNEPPIIFENESGAEIIEGEINEKSESGLSKYFLFNNAFGMQKGTGYFQSILIIVNQVHFGISDNFSIGGGLVPLFLAGSDQYFGASASPIWALPSFSFPIVENSFSLGLNGIFVALLGRDPSTLAFLKGTATVGSARNNLTFGLGYGYGGEGGWPKSPLVYLSGMVRTGKKHSLVTENFLIRIEDTTWVYLIFGGRFTFKGGFFDYGLVLPADTSEDLPFPWLSLTIPFGKRK